MKSLRAKDGSDEPPSGSRNGERDFHGEKRSNDMQSSTTDPESRLYRKGKGKEAKLSYIGNALTENRHGLVVEAELGSATGTIEREAAQTMIVHHSPESRRLTLGADKAYDARVRRRPARPQRNTAHYAEHDWRTSAVDALTTRHPGYAISQKKRKRNRGAVRLGLDYRRACPAHAARSRTLEIQVYLDDGRLRPDPVAQLARHDPAESSPKMDSTPTKLAIMKSLSPCRTAGHHTPSARISVAC
jgi:hypothetical protein